MNSIHPPIQTSELSLCVRRVKQLNANKNNLPVDERKYSERKYMNKIEFTCALRVCVCVHIKGALLLLKIWAKSTTQRCIPTKKKIFTRKCEKNMLEFDQTTLSKVGSFFYLHQSKPSLFRNLLFLLIFCFLFQAIAPICKFLIFQPKLCLSIWPVAFKIIHDFSKRYERKRAICSEIKSWKDSLFSSFSPFVWNAIETKISKRKL